MTFDFVPCTMNSGVAVSTSRRGDGVIQRRSNHVTSESNVLSRELDIHLFLSCSAGGGTGGDFDAQNRLAALRRRLVSLDAAFYEEFGRQLDSASKEALLHFMRHHPSARIPLLASDSQGYLVGTWRNALNCVTLRFLSRSTFQFATTLTKGEAVERNWGSIHPLLVLTVDPAIEATLT